MYLVLLGVAGGVALDRIPDKVGGRHLVLGGLPPKVRSGPQDIIVVVVELDDPLFLL